MLPTNGSCRKHFIIYAVDTKVFRDRNRQAEQLNTKQSHLFFFSFFFFAFGKNESQSNPFSNTLIWSGPIHELVPSLSRSTPINQSINIS